MPHFHGSQGLFGDKDTQFLGSGCESYTNLACTEVHVYYVGLIKLRIIGNYGFARITSVAFRAALLESVAMSNPDRPHQKHTRASGFVGRRLVLGGAIPYECASGGAGGN